jgi:hypothetical protein
MITIIIIEEIIINKEIVKDIVNAKNVKTRKGQIGTTKIIICKETLIKEEIIVKNVIKIEIILVIKEIISINTTIITKDKIIIIINIMIIKIEDSMVVSHLKGIMESICNIKKKERVQVLIDILKIKI